MERIVDIATDGRHLSAYRGFLVVSEDRAEVGRIPLDDVAAVIIHAHGVTWTTNLVVALAVDFRRELTRDWSEPLRLDQGDVKS
ncbi:MAG: hypothetical protein WBA42_08905 [Mesorhizobium sp.]